jgi:nicotinate-nucleotide adenylyltransferase
MDVVRRLGIMGGTFDPPHYGHLFAALEAAHVLALERVLFIPTAQPPHKVGEPVTPMEHRAAMIGLAIADNPLFDLSTIELERGGLSYTIQTARELHRRHPDAELHFIVGMDSLAELPTWYQPAAILEIAWLAAVSRSGVESVDLSWLETQVPGAQSRVRIIPMPGLDISSTDLRDRIRDDRPLRYLVPDPVVDYVAEHALYRD